MKKLIIVVMGLAMVAALAGCGGSGGIATAALADEMIEVGCGSCMYDMEGVKGCVTAANIDGTPYLVSGVKLKAHAVGLCDMKKQAKVSGRVEGGKFVASALELVATQ